MVTPFLNNPKSWEQDMKELEQWERDNPSPPMKDTLIPVYPFYLFCEGLPPCEFALLIVICTLLDKNGFYTLNEADLSKRCGEISIRQIRKHFNELVAADTLIEFGNDPNIRRFDTHWNCIKKLKMKPSETRSMEEVRAIAGKKRGKK